MEQVGADEANPPTCSQPWDRDGDGDRDGQHCQLLAAPTLKHRVDSLCN